jgi:hypothetical protein
MKNTKKLFNIWSEGFQTNGESDTASYHGQMEADTFKEACQIMFKEIDSYDPKRNTLWGCRLFDNERDARRSFG